jgi:hypothetical protein
MVPLYELILDSFREKTAVDSVNNRLGTDLTSTKESSIQALDGVLASLYTIKLKVDVTLGVGVKSNVDDVTIFLLTLGFDIVFELLYPSVSFFPVFLLAKQRQAERNTYSAGLNMFRRRTQRLAWLTATGSGLASAFG